jgi:single-stranded-DNA-specific exonuclease
VKKEWQSFKPDSVRSLALSQELFISPLTAQALINRGVKSKEEAEAFISPRLRHLRDPEEIPNIVPAAKRVVQAKERNEKVLVYGDFDVDGVTATAILIETLRFLGIENDYYIPHRYGEGYSLSEEAVEKIAASGVKLIITVDCGISNHKEIELAHRLGVDVIVTDHHILLPELPKAHAVVNPKMIKGPHPSRDLSGAGVAFKFAWELLRQFDKKDNEFLTSLLDLAALGTLSDVVPLNQENRTLAVGGIKLIAGKKRTGIRCLAEVASLGENISVRDIHFALAPRLNAAGRLEHASKSVELLLCRDSARAKALAQELNSINIRRQDIGEEIREEVLSRLSEDYIAENKVVVLSGDNWHPGVIGIIASRVVDRYFRPTILIGINDGVGRGSARSISGVNIFDLLNRCRDLFSDFGGHAGAAGFEIDPANIPMLKNRLQEEFKKQVSAEALTPKILIDAELKPSQVSMSLIKELKTLAPYGEGNPSPVFMSRGLTLSTMRTVGKGGKHLKAKFSDDQVTLETIGFDLGEYEGHLSYDHKYDIVFNLGTNQWDGFEVAQLSLIDIRESNDK